MKKKTKYIITFLIGVVSFIVGFILYFFIPISEPNDNIANEEIDKASETLTMLKITVDELDIVNANKEVIGKALRDEVYQVYDLTKEDEIITYTIKYNDLDAFISIDRIKQKSLIEIFNEKDKSVPSKIVNTTNKNTLSIPAEKDYYCESGYTLKDDKCQKVTEVNATSSEKVECTSGTYDEFTDSCNINVQYDLDTKANEYCQTNGLSDKKTCCEAVNGIYGSWDASWCYGVTRKSLTPRKVTTYSCDSGWKLNGSKCEKTVIESAKYKYVCPSSYTLEQDLCIKNN